MTDEYNLPKSLGYSGALQVKLTTVRLGRYFTAATGPGGAVIIAIY